jgi:hypothetical protein
MGVEICPECDGWLITSECCPSYCDSCGLGKVIDDTEENNE